MASVSAIVGGIAGIAVAMTVLPAFAQSNLDAGKSPAQIFAHTCNACHRSPREIKKTTAAFMREHYTTGTQEAATMAAYLNSIGTDPKAVETRRKPVLGAGREQPGEQKAGEQKPGEQKTGEQKPGEQKAGETQQTAVVAPAATGKPPANGRLRRPAESFEADSTLAASFMAEQPPATQPAPAVVPASSGFEE